MFPPNATQQTHISGEWSLFIDGVNRTFVRGAPVQIASMEDTDPFGPASASLNFQQISALEPIGEPGTELEWLRPNARVEINFTVDKFFAKSLYTMYRGPLDPWPEEVKGTESWYQNYSWKGFIVGVSWQSTESQSSVSVDCVGALRVLDNILQLDRKTTQPVAYETAIQRAINHACRRLGADDQGLRIAEMEEPWAFFTKNGEDLGLSKFDMNDVIIFDGGVPAENVAPNPAGVEWWRIPEGIKDGQYWSGMLTRDRGNNDKTISGYVQGLLEMMYTRKGRFSIRLKHNTWQPELFHNNLFAFHDNQKTLHVDAAWPGVKMNIDQDFSQSVTTVYGTVSSQLDGSSYTGEEFDAFGRESWIEPFADNSEISENIMRREAFIQFVDGLGTDEALAQAREHVSRNSEPGYTGQITLQGVDPRLWELFENNQYGGEQLVFPQQLIRAGMYIRLNGFQGRSGGLIFYISNVNHNIESNTTTLTVDSKARDFLTVELVRNRGRDSMAPVHLLTVGSYQGSTAQDRLLPWDPKESGFIPDASKEMWNQMVGFADSANKPTTSKWYGHTSLSMSNFPWYDLCKAFPPKDNSSFYAKVPAISQSEDPYPWGRAGQHRSPYDVGRFWYPNQMGEEYDARWYAFNVNSPYWVLRTEDENGDPVDPPTAMTWEQAPSDVYQWPPLDLTEDEQESYKTIYGAEIWETKPSYVLQLPSQEWIPKWWASLQEAIQQKAEWPPNNVRLSFQSQASSLKMMCVDENGNPLDVCFYFGLYKKVNVGNGDGEPQVPAGNYPDYFINNSQLFPSFKAHTNTRYYEEGSNYPFFPYAGESKLPDGTDYGPGGNFMNRMGDEDVLLRLGSYWERPGFWPYSMQDAEASQYGPTGLLVHDSTFDVSAQTQVFGTTPTLPSSISDLSVGHGAFTIFCDDKPFVDKYFIGRIYVEQRGSSR